MHLGMDWSFPSGRDGTHVAQVVAGEVLTRGLSAGQVALFPQNSGSAVSMPTTAAIRRAEGASTALRRCTGMRMIA